MSLDWENQSQDHSISSSLPLLRQIIKEENIKGCPLWNPGEEPCGKAKTHLLKEEQPTGEGFISLEILQEALGTTSHIKLNKELPQLVSKENSTYIEVTFALVFSFNTWDHGFPLETPEGTPHSLETPSVGSLLGK